MEQNTKDELEQNKFTMGIDLQEGFDNDQVVVIINGDEVYRNPKTDTKLLLGYADTFQIKVPQGKLTISIQLPEKKKEKVILLDVDRDLNLGVSCTSTDLEYFISDKPFFYL